MKKFLIGAVAAAGLALASQANAAQVIYNLTLSGCSSSCGAGPYGTVTVTDFGNDSLSYVVQLLNGAQFNVSGNSSTHESFDFDLVGSPTITYSNVTSGFVDAGGISDASPFGAFTYSLNLTTPTHNPSNVSKLEFTVTALTALSVNSVGSTTNSNNSNQQLAFVADVSSNGNTGNVAALAGGTPGGVPEPATWAMMLVGFGGMGALLRHRRRQGRAAIA